MPALGVRGRRAAGLTRGGGAAFGLRSMALSAAEAWAASNKEANTVASLMWKNEQEKPQATAFRGFMAENESLWSYSTLAMQSTRLAATMIEFNVLAQKSTVALWSEKHIEHVRPRPRRPGPRSAHPAARSSASSCPPPSSASA